MNYYSNICLAKTGEYLDNNIYRSNWKQNIFKIKFIIYYREKRMHRKSFLKLYTHLGVV